MNKIYVVMVETTEDEEVSNEILDNRFYENRDDARIAMINDFDINKIRFDATDDITESHSLDSCNLEANMEWFKTWNVVELGK